MIALNILIDNFDEYKHIYEIMGKKVNLDLIKTLEDKRKTIQLSAESNRSNCNKLCKNIAFLKADNKDTKPELDNIIELDKTINIQNNQISKITIKIDNLLSKLPNIPYEIIENNLTIYENNKNYFNSQEVFNTIKNDYSNNDFCKSINAYLKQNQNKLINEAELPVMVFSNNYQSIFTTIDNFDDLIKNILDTIKRYSTKIIQLKTTKLDRQSKAVFLALFQDKLISIKIIGDYQTRSYKIKYHNNKTDQTNFACQLLIEY